MVHTCRIIFDAVRTYRKFYEERGIFASYAGIFICPFSRGYSCVALYQEVVPFSKAMGLVLGSEIVIPEKVCMGRGPLVLE